MDLEFSRISQTVVESKNTLLEPLWNTLDDVNEKIDGDWVKISDSVKGWTDQFKHGADIQTVVRGTCWNWDMECSCLFFVRFLYVRGGAAGDHHGMGSSHGYRHSWKDFRQHPDRRGLVKQPTKGGIPISESFMDRVVGRDLSFFALGLVTLQTVSTLFTQNDISLLEEVRRCF